MAQAIEEAIAALEKKEETPVNPAEPTEPTTQVLQEQLMVQQSKK